MELLIAFGAGLLSFLSPCVLPLIPSYVTFITGLSLDDVQNARRAALVHGTLFVLGFTLIFLAMGATATLLGQALLQYRDWISRIGGVVIIIFGFYLLGVLNIGFLSRERRFHVADKIFHDYRIDPDLLRPIGRMGGPTYTRTTDRFNLERPKLVR